MSWRDKYDQVGNFNEGRAGVLLNNKCGHVDENGKVTTSIIYDGVGHFEEGRAKVRLNYKYGIVDKKGKIVDGWHDLIKGAFE
jgi:hypothetical protein